MTMNEEQLENRLYWLERNQKMLALALVEREVYKQLCPQTIDTLQSIK